MPRQRKDAAGPSSSEAAKKGQASTTRRCNCNRLTDRIFGAIAASTSRKGVSLTALKKELRTDQYDVRKHNNRINKEVKSMVSRGALLQVSGRGASGTFRIARTTRKKKNSKGGKASTLKKTPGKESKRKTSVSTSSKSASSKSQRKYGRQGSPLDKKRSGRGNQSGARQRSARE